MSIRNTQRNFWRPIVSALHICESILVLCTRRTKVDYAYVSFGIVRENNIFGLQITMNNLYFYQMVKRDQALPGNIFEQVPWHTCLFVLCDVRI